MFTLSTTQLILLFICWYTAGVTAHKAQECMDSKDIGKAIALYILAAICIGIGVTIFYF